jgi:hypothetical protein
MIMRLDQIEARLQAVIESSVVLFARGDAQHRLAHQLVDAARQNLRTTSDGRETAPSLFTIHLHPETLAYWKAHSHLLDAISANLADVAREYGVAFASDPQIRLEPDTSLPSEGIRVEAGEQYGPSGHTAAFAAAPSAAQNPIPSNAFLIVEGSRVFPLSQPVINIGRRNDNQLILADPRVSRAHAQIRAVRGQYVLFDLNSTGGTMVNGRRIHQCALKPGDVVSLSGVPLIYGEETPDDDTYEMGTTRSMIPGNSEPPEIIE